MKKIFAILVLFALCGSVSAGQYSYRPMLSPDHKIPEFMGDIWYVDAGVTSSGTGRITWTAFKTIGEAMSAASAGDAIKVKSGTYTEAGLDLDKYGQELWFEIGVVIQPATGTALTISGNSCKVIGMCKIIPASGQIGLSVSGTECHIEHIKVSTGGTGYKITGAGSMIVNCAAGDQTSIGYDIQAGSARLRDCKTRGAGASYGYKISNGVDTGVLDNCTSVGHQTAGYYIDSGSIDWTVLRCSSGGGDGKWRDIDNANVWSNFSFDDEVSFEVDFSAGGPTSYDLFTVNGSVRIYELFGHVNTQLSNTACTFKIVLYSSNGSADLTGVSANVAAAVVGSTFVRNAPSDEALDFGNPAAAPVIIENTSTKNPKIAIDVVADPGATTTVRLVASADLAEGIVRFHCHWMPLSNTGFLSNYIAP